MCRNSTLKVDSVGKLLKFFNGSKETKFGQATREAVACQFTPVLVRAATSTCIAPLENPLPPAPRRGLPPIFMVTLNKINHQAMFIQVHVNSHASDELSLLLVLRTQAIPDFLQYAVWDFPHVRDRYVWQESFQT